MTPDELQALKDAAQLLKDSGLLDQLTQSIGEPGGQTALIYSLIAIVAVFATRVLLINKIVAFHAESLAHKKTLLTDIERALDIFKRVEQFLESISQGLLTIQKGQEEEKSRLSNLYALLVGRRKRDDPIDF